MWLVAGLGNPGSGYERNRHNIGFMALDAIVRRHWPMGNWRARFQGNALEFALGGEKILALKPGTFMNLSGNAVVEAVAFYKIPPERIIVLHDDLDLDPGRVEVKRGGGHGGHNGLKSLDARLGQDYWRVRLGIGHPAKGMAGVPKEIRDRLVTDHVLGNFSKEEARGLEPVLDRVAEALPEFLSGSHDMFRAALRGESASIKYEEQK
jgi:PTH1 family peptidyl-tRNA hydrolase